MEVTKASHDFARWSIRHHFYIDDETLSAILNMDGAWIDVGKRKLTVPGADVQNIFNDFPKSDDFQWVERPTKNL